MENGAAGEVLEFLGNAGLRVLFPRTGGWSDELSWPWGVGVIIAMIAIYATRFGRSATVISETEHLGHSRKSTFRLALWASWGGLVWSLFFFRGVAPPELQTREIYRGVWPFIYIQLAAVVIVMFFPAIATWLPTSMGWMNK